MSLRTLFVARCGLPVPAVALPKFLAGHCFCLRHNIFMQGPQYFYARATVFLCRGHSIPMLGPQHSYVGATVFPCRDHNIPLLGSQYSSAELPRFLCWGNKILLHGAERFPCSIPILCQKPLPRHPANVSEGFPLRNSEKNWIFPGPGVPKIFKNCKIGKLGSSFE